MPVGDRFREIPIPARYPEFIRMSKLTSRRPWWALTTRWSPLLPYYRAP